ncbi:MAG: valine--tRNA ligase [Alphaproteobacteria bacterium]
MAIEKTFDPNAVEQRLYDRWEQSGAFKAGAGAEEGAETFSIVIPPPNVTGSLHMGHALNNTLQDILIRFNRMRGKDVLWQPGTDHAGIATQMVVERNLAQQGDVTRHDMGRERFLETVWEWKEESGGTIFRQLRRLGASCDWSRERFTMDEGLSEAVLKVFVQLYKEGLIYKDKRLVNWDPKLLTAISDLEVENKEINGHMWHFRYPLADGSGHITVATTRPETMLGDTAVAVHPDDERYKALVGKMVMLPLANREIPIVADSYADPEQGSGAVKITPAHDFNDFEVGKRNDLEKINILDVHGCLNENVPGDYQGMDRFDARKKVVADLDALGLLEKIDDHTLMVPYGDRSGVVIEPYLTDQWYVDAPTLAKEATAAVEDGRTKFVPKNWDKTYFEWMRNIQPWCVSRQLWWGHQIPAWYDADGDFYVALSEDEAYVEARAAKGEGVTLTRDEDVLDTWFSSALWPFSTLGWPEETPELAKYYPTNVLITGFDIIFFWVARMMMQGLKFRGEIPFHDVYVHALVRDENGQKMSKSKGNVIDPLELVGEYGADALRFTLTAMAAQGRDVRLSNSRIEGYRNFGTKLWNAARFCEMNGCDPAADTDPSAFTEPVNRWIAGEVKRTEQAVREALEAYKFDEAAGALYRFIWNVYCDWYLEFIKPLLNDGSAAQQAESRAAAAWALDQILIMLHPIMPFMTEELWQVIGQRVGGRDTDLILARWPACDWAEDAAADKEMDWVLRLISSIRSVRSEMNVPAGAKIPVSVQGLADDAALEAHKALLMRMARLSDIAVGEAPKGALQTVVDGATYFLAVGDVMDIEAELKRLAKEIDKLSKLIKQVEGKLQNEKFMANAPADVVEKERGKQTEMTATRAKLEEARTRLAEAA